MANGSFGDAGRDQLRTVVAAVEHAVAQLPTGDGTSSSDGVRASWSALVKQLALGPAPETRVCPSCSGVGMKAASRCLHCWAKLEPLELTASAPGATHLVEAAASAASATPATPTTTHDAARPA